MIFFVIAVLFAPWDTVIFLTPFVGFSSFVGFISYAISKHLDKYYLHPEVRDGYWFHGNRVSAPPLILLLTFVVILVSSVGAIEASYSAYVTLSMGMFFSGVIAAWKVVVPTFFPDGFFDDLYAEGYEEIIEQARKERLAELKKTASGMAVVLVQKPELQQQVEAIAGCEDTLKLEQIITLTTHLDNIYSEKMTADQKRALKIHNALQPES